MFRPCVLVALGLALFSAQAQAQVVTHPIWASTPNAEWDAAAKVQFEVALQRRGLGPLDVVPITAPDNTRLAQLVADGMSAFRAAAYDRAVTALTEAAARARAEGGGGLDKEALASLFFHQAAAIQLASGAVVTQSETTIALETAQAAYLTAAALEPLANLGETSPHLIVATSWRLALATIKGRPRSELVVHAHPRALISLDGRMAKPSPATFVDLPFGEHLVRVEEPGHAPWGIAVTLGRPQERLDVPATQRLVYDAAAAAARARAKGASYALVGQLHLGDHIEIDLRLVDATSGAVRDSSAVALAAQAVSPDLVAAVLRLDEEASRQDLERRVSKGSQAGASFPMILPPAPPAKDEQSGSWLSRHWPLATAVGVAVAGALVFGILVANDWKSHPNATP